MARSTKIITISISPELIESAKSYNINVSQAAAAGITAAIEREQKIRALGL